MLRPAVAFAIFWMTGLAMTLEGARWAMLQWLLAICLFVAIVGMARKNKSGQAFICLLLLVASASYGASLASSNDTALPQQADSFPVQGRLAQPVKLDGDRIRFTLDMNEPEKGKLAVTMIAAAPDELEEAGRWQRGDRLHVSGELAMAGEARNFGQFDYRTFLKRQRTHRVLTVRGLGEVAHLSDTGWNKYAINRLTDRIRSDMIERIDGLFGARGHAGLMSGLLIGHQEDLEEQRYEVFSRLGLTHVIAISGLHVGIVVGVLLVMLRLFRLTRETSLMTVIFLIPVYVLLTGAAPSIVRSGMMSIIALYALKRGWLKDGLNILAVSACVMTAWNPYYIYNIGFQLSFAVTAGLIMTVPKLSVLLPGPRWLANAIAVTAGAQLVSLPLTVFYFNQFSLLSFVANLVLVPAFSLLVLPAGYAALSMSYIAKPPAKLVADITSFMIDWCYKAMDVLDSLPGLIIWATPSVIWIFIYYLLLALVIELAYRAHAAALPVFRLRRRSLRAALSGALAALVLWTIGGWQYGLWQSRGTIAFLDVGQGDAIVVRTPGNRTLLIDGGGTIRFHRPGEEWRQRSKPFEIGADLLLPLLRQRGVRTIDYVIATHAHVDHIGGLSTVLEHIPVKRLLFNGTRSSGGSDKGLFDMAESRSIPIYAASAGRRIVIDKYTSILVLYPYASADVFVESNQNHYSVVLLLQMRDYTFLLTGDMDAAAERAVLANMEADSYGEDNWPWQRESLIHVMKIAHHGSRTSTTSEWLNYWTPNYAVISAGINNRYGHPSPDVLERLAQYGSNVLRTDRSGEVQFRIRNGVMTWRAKVATLQ